MHLVTIRAYKSFLMTWLSSNAARQRDWKAFLILLREALNTAYHPQWILFCMSVFGLSHEEKGSRLLPTSVTDCKA
jgi:hypothetical protein